MELAKVEVSIGAADGGEGPGPKVLLQMLASSITGVTFECGGTTMRVVSATITKLDGYYDGS